MSAFRSTPALPIPGAPFAEEPNSALWPRRWRVSVSRRLSILVRHKPSPSNRRGAAAGDPRTATLRAFGDMTQWDAVQAFASKCAATIQRSPAGHGGKSAPATPVLVDLSHVDCADTKLIACLVCTLTTARQAGRTVEFRFSPAVKAWVSLCGLGSVLRG